MQKPPLMGWKCASRTSEGGIAAMHAPCMMVFQGASRALIVVSKTGFIALIDGCMCDVLSAPATHHDGPHASSVGVLPCTSELPQLYGSLHYLRRHTA